MIITTSPRGLQLTILLSEEEINDIVVAFKQASEAVGLRETEDIPLWTAALHTYGVNIVRVVLGSALGNAHLSDIHPLLRRELNITP